jgi:virginiamycin B lyase
MMRAVRRPVLSVAVLLACLAAVCLAAAAAASKPLRLGSGFEVEALAPGPGRALWYAGTNAAVDPPHVFVGRFSSSGAHKTWDYKTAAGPAGVGDLVRGPDGEMWLTVPSADEVARIEADGQWHGFVGPEGSRPTGLTAADSKVWATLEGTGRLVSLDTAQKPPAVEEYFLPSGIAPTGITFGPRNSLWSIGAGSGLVVRVTLAGTAGYVPLESGDKQDYAGTVNTDIAAAHDGSLWFAQGDRAAVGRLSVSPRPGDENASYLRFGLPGGGPTTLISQGPTDDMWFADRSGRIGSVTAKGVVGELACATRCGTAVTALARGADGKLWFAAGNEVAPFQPRPLALGFKRVSRQIDRRGNLTMQIACRGGAAGQRCTGRVEIRQGSRILERTPHSGVTGGIDEIGVPLNTTIVGLLRAKGQLHARLVLVTAGKVTATRALDIDVTRPS